MPVFSCTNCGFRFESEEKRSCPRCSSAETGEFKQSRQQRDGHTVVKQEYQSSISSKPLVHYRDGKDGWKDFHGTQVTACPHCGGKEFDLNYKKKEKVCRKCGEILALPRRYA